MGEVLAVCLSREKGVQKEEVPEIELRVGHGIVGDAHAGDWHRQISLLADESVDRMRASGLALQPGAFAENILTRGLDLKALPVGTRLRVGPTLLEVTQIGKEQLGITLTNDKGEYPPYTCTWQFNLHFDCDKDQHSNESISMLYNSGIDFNLMKNKGIPHSLFAEYLIVSGLVLNEKITWICFNGSSDFAYLLKYLINDFLPDDEESFINLINLYFPNLYDIKYLVNDNEAYKGGLNKLAKELDVERSGEIHQAGSDSQVTSDVFFRLVRNNAISSNDLNNGKNVIYGIGNGADAQETINYTQFEQGVDITFLLQSINPAMNFKTNIQMNNNFQDKMFK